MLLALVSLLAFYLAWNLGANDVANSMGTAVGSRAITLKQALLIAGVLELAGALLFGPKVTATLATQIVNPALFSEHPAEFVMGMIAVVIACGIWLNIATGLRLPVSSSHAVVGAIAGFGWLAAGTEAVAWRSIGIITVSWLLTPAISGAIAALFYVILQQSILKSPDAIYRWQEAIPWISTAMFGIFGVLVFPRVAQPVQTFLADQVGWVLPEHDISILIGVIAVISFTWLSLSQLKFVGQDGIAPAQLAPAPAAIAPSLAAQPASPAFASPIEAQLVRFQVLSACFVAFAHGANDVGNAIAPLAAIAYVNHTGSVPLGSFQTPFWVLLLGGTGIVAGLAVWGKKVIATVGQGIIPLQPSGGFCAQLATATTVLLASQLGLPVSTSHAIVGGVVGVGLVQGAAIQLKTLRQIGLVWVITIPAATSIAAIAFLLIRRFLTDQVVWSIASGR